MMFCISVCKDTDGTMLLVAVLPSLLCYCDVVLRAVTAASSAATHCKHCKLSLISAADVQSQQHNHAL
jgi:hypothetical protein